MDLKQKLKGEKAFTFFEGEILFKLPFHDRQQNFLLQEHIKKDLKDKNFCVFNVDYTLDFIEV